MQYIPDVQRAWHRICAGWKTKESENKREAGLLLGVIEGGEGGGGYEEETGLNISQRISAATPSGWLGLDRS